MQFSQYFLDDSAPLKKEISPISQLVKTEPRTSPARENLRPEAAA